MTEVFKDFITSYYKRQHRDTSYDDSCILQCCGNYRRTLREQVFCGGDTDSGQTRAPSCTVFLQLAITTLHPPHNLIHLSCWIQDYQKRIVALIAFLSVQIKSMRKILFYKCAGKIKCIVYFSFSASQAVLHSIFSTVCESQVRAAVSSYYLVNRQIDIYTAP